jgi:predicted O-methyltransferase YrrM
LSHVRGCTGIRIRCKEDVMNAVPHTQPQPDIDALLAELYAFGERAGGMWNIGPEGGAFLAWLVGLLGAHRALEIGTSNGYSGIWLARALRRTGGALVTLEVEPRKIEMAHANFERAGVSDVITLVAGPAVASLQALGGTFELVFIDADKPQYPDYLREARRLLAPGALIVADNLTTHPEETAPYRVAVAADATLESVEVPLGGGLLVSRVVG